MKNINIQMNTIIPNDAQETKVLKELPKWLITLKSNDDHKYNLNDNFKLYVFKNSMDKSMMKIDQNIYFNMLIINFNIRKEDIKDQIFIELSKKRNELSYNSFKKLRNNLIKQSLMKIESENKMINLILQIDISGNIDKLQSTEAINEKYKNECQLYLNIISELKKLELSFKKQRVALNENYGKLSRHASVLFKWIFKFNLQKICYLVNPDTLINFLKNKKYNYFIYFKD